MNLRHTWATLAVESGTDVLIVAQMLGHTDASMAYKRYVKPSNAVHRRVQRQFNLLVTKGVMLNNVSVFGKIGNAVRSMWNSVIGFVTSPQLTC